MEVILKYVQTIIDTILKLPGLVFLIFLFPFFASIVVDIFRIQILQLFGFNIPNEILTGILVGFILFASLSLFNIELRILDLPKFSRFNKNKFIISIFIMPMIIGIISKSYNINLDYNDLKGNYVRRFDISKLTNYINQTAINYKKIINLNLSSKVKFKKIDTLELTKSLILMYANDNLKFVNKSYPDH